MKTNNTIKLLYVDSLSDGTKRYQSQLLVGKDSCDFIMRSDGVMMCWDKEIFYPYSQPFKIVSSVEEMRLQHL